MVKFYLVECTSQLSFKHLFLPRLCYNFWIQYLNLNFILEMKWERTNQPQHIWIQKFNSIVNPRNNYVIFSCNKHVNMFVLFRLKKYNKIQLMCIIGTHYSYRPLLFLASLNILMCFCVYIVIQSQYVLFAQQILTWWICLKIENIDLFLF